MVAHFVPGSRACREAIAVRSSYVSRMFGNGGVDSERRDFNRRIGRGDRQGAACKKGNEFGAKEK